MHRGHVGADLVHLSFDCNQLNCEVLFVGAQHLNLVLQIRDLHGLTLALGHIMINLLESALEQGRRIKLLLFATKE